MHKEIDWYCPERLAQRAEEQEQMWRHHRPGRRMSMGTQTSVHARSITAPSVHTVIVVDPSAFREALMDLQEALEKATVSTDEVVRRVCAG